jgi:hypothetical protein
MFDYLPNLGAIIVISSKIHLCISHMDWRSKQLRKRPGSFWSCETILAFRRTTSLHFITLGSLRYSCHLIETTFVLLKSALSRIYWVLL